MNSVSCKEVKLSINTFKDSDVRISAGSLIQTLVLLKFIGISDFLKLHFAAINLLLFLVEKLRITECFGKIFAFKFKHLNSQRQLPIAACQLQPTTEYASEV